MAEDIGLIDKLSDIDDEKLKAELKRRENQRKFLRFRASKERLRKLSYALRDDEHDAVIDAFAPKHSSCGSDGFEQAPRDSGITSRDNICPRCVLLDIVDGCIDDDFCVEFTLNVRVERD